MKKILTVLAFALLCINLHAASSASNTADKPVSSLLEMEAMPLDMSQMSHDDFMSMTPKKYKEMTGKRMGVKQALKLKMAQKMAKKSSGGDIPKGLYIVLAIFGLAWIGMGVMDDWEGNNWWVTLS